MKLVKLVGCCFFPKDFRNGISKGCLKGVPKDGCPKGCPYGCHPQDLVLYRYGFQKGLKRLLLLFLFINLFHSCYSYNWISTAQYVYQFVSFFFSVWDGSVILLGNKSEMSWIFQTLECDNPKPTTDDRFGGNLENQDVCKLT